MVGMSPKETGSKIAILQARLESNASQRVVVRQLHHGAGVSFHYPDCLGILAEHK